jgi:hypothetical protein
MRKITAIALLVLYSQSALASDFSILMWMLLVPFGILALVIWASTWLTTSELKPFWMKAAIRTFGMCLIFTPTHTGGGNGKMYSVALYDIVMSGFGGDPIYAKQAMLNVVVATVVVTVVAILAARHSQRTRAGR